MVPLVMNHQLYLSNHPGSVISRGSRGYTTIISCASSPFIPQVQVTIYQNITTAPNIISLPAVWPSYSARLHKFHCH